MTSTGVAVGVHVEVLVCNNTGMPPAVTRVAPTSHCAVTHGPFPPGDEKGQPVMVWRLAMVAIAMPLTVTRGNGVVSCACPPWVHITLAFS